MTRRPLIRDVDPGVLGLRGEGVVYADQARELELAQALTGAGYLVRYVDGTVAVDRGTALPALADALQLPGAADRNLDALADTLTDLRDVWPDDDRVALVWRHADRIIAADPQLWAVLTDIATRSSEFLWSGERDDDVAFELVALVPVSSRPPHAEEGR